MMKYLCHLDEKQIHNILIEVLSKKYKRVIDNDQYILAEGTTPICLIAHLDTVFNATPDLDDFIYDQEQKILWAPHGAGFDDRAGVYAILELVLRGHRPHIIFTHGEEHGGIGAHALITQYMKCPFKKCKAIIELDRANEKDMVFYGCDSEEFEKYIGKFGFETDIGTFTDISILCPIWKIAGVNLSVGYVEEHTPNERLYCDWLDATIEKVEKMFSSTRNMPKFKYKQKPTISYRFNTNSICPTSSNVFISDDSCLICGKKLAPAQKCWIYDEEFPYCVCNSCFNLYYVDTENEEPNEFFPFDF